MAMIIDDAMLAIECGNPLLMDVPPNAYQHLDKYIWANQEDIGYGK